MNIRPSPRRPSEVSATGHATIVNSVLTPGSSSPPLPHAPHLVTPCAANVAPRSGSPTRAGMRPGLEMAQVVQEVDPPVAATTTSVSPVHARAQRMSQQGATSPNVTAEVVAHGGGGSMTTAAASAISPQAATVANTKEVQQSQSPTPVQQVSQQVVVAQWPGASQLRVQPVQRPQPQGMTESQFLQKQLQQQQQQLQLQQRQLQQQQQLLERQQQQQQQLQMQLQQQQQQQLPQAQLRQTLQPHVEPQVIANAGQRWRT